MEYVKKYYVSDGWKVKDESKIKNLGYDFLCKKKSLEKHVEVKGWRGAKEEFCLKISQKRHAETDDRFVLAVVTNALTKTPNLSCYTSLELFQNFELAPREYWTYPPRFRAGGPYLIPGLGAAPCPPAGAAYEPIPPWRKYLHWVSVATAKGIIFTPAERMHSLLMFYFPATERGDKRIYRLSLTMPLWEPSPERIRRAAQALADAVAAEEGGGAWLAIDVTPEGREHLYGMAISSQTPDNLSKLWIALSGASEDGCKVRPVTGQKYGWGDEQKAPSRLGENLARVVHYGLKSLPPRYEMTARERVTTAGCLRELWERACGDWTPPAEPKQSLGESCPQAAGLRCCQMCGGRVRTKMRQHAKWCSPSCRTTAYEERRRLRAMLTADELDAFEERVAILECDAGLKGPQAEQRAFEQLRRPALVLSALPPSFTSAYPELV